MSTRNRIVNVAVVGAGGNSGKFIVKSLLAAGKHKITAITRTGSDSTLPNGVVAQEVDYAKPETLVKALGGQDALVITLSAMAEKGRELALVEAAAQAGVKWIIPNDWSPDTENPALLQDISIFPPKRALREKIAQIGKSSYVSLSVGFWYEMSLAIEPAFGFDLGNRKATFFDDGSTRITVSTWPQTGRAVAALLSLPIEKEGDAACLAEYRNQVVYLGSFTLSQQEMLESALRVTGTKANDWTIAREPAKERYEAASKAVGEGDRKAFVKYLYTRIFYPDGSGDTEDGKGTINKALGLPKEDLDEATKVAVERAKGPK